MRECPECQNDVDNDNLTTYAGVTMCLSCAQMFRYEEDDDEEDEDYDDDDDWSDRCPDDEEDEDYDDDDDCP